MAICTRAGASTLRPLRALRDNRIRFTQCPQRSQKGRHKMKILLIGASGTIGRRIYKTLSKKHEIIRASRSGEDVEVDITSADSIETMYKSVAGIDAVICA